MRYWRGLAVTILVVGVTGLYVSRPQPLPASTFDGITGDATAGEITFAAAGCASCHTAPDSDDPSILSGGKAFATDFGTFFAPNISTSGTHGIGAWSDLEIASAIMRGVSPDNAHYYPAFPYAAYQKADPRDIADLIAYLRTLPAAETPSKDHDVGFPFNIRTSLGGWKLLFARSDWVMPEPQNDDIIRGRYLVEALGHCGECHTARNALGGLDRSAWLGGAANPNGDGRIPNITPGGLDWSAGDIAEYLKSGFTPDFDTAGAEMAEVVRNTSQLTDADRAAIAAYLKAVPAVPDP